MNKIITLLSLFVIYHTANAQVTIGKEVINGSSALLDFYDQADNFKGIILPAVENTNNALATNPSVNNGTFLFDRTDNKIKMYSNNTWVNLSLAGNGSNLIVNSSSENQKDQGVIIGNSTSSAKGVLILESEDMSLILPKIANPHTTVKSPYAGMICYDTVSKALAVFDGKNWNYWK